jgi:hypothetical protein
LKSHARTCKKKEEKRGMLNGKWNGMENKNGKNAMFLDIVLYRKIIKKKI